MASNQPERDLWTEQDEDDTATEPTRYYLIEIKYGCRLYGIVNNDVDEESG